MNANSLYHGLINARIAGMRVLDFEDKATVETQLRFSYHLMAATPNLLKIGEKAAEAQGNKNLQSYYRQHFAEESDHGPWMKRDLEVSGISLSPLPREAIQLAGTQYYLTYHCGAESLLGYMLAIEGFAPPVVLVDRMEESFGFKLSCLRHHCEVDPGHTQDLLARIDENSASHESKAAIFEAAFAAMRTLCLFTEHLQDGHYAE